jgi:hypothetical protein
MPKAFSIRESFRAAVLVAKVNQPALTTFYNAKNETHQPIIVATGTR